MNSILSIKVELFKNQNPNLVPFFLGLTDKYKNTNPLVLIDLVKNNSAPIDLCKVACCCKCLKENVPLITTLVNGNPAKFCSVECISTLD